jgi:hypothetical protein
MGRRDRKRTVGSIGVGVKAGAGGRAIVAEEGAGEPLMEG